MNEKRNLKYFMRESAKIERIIKYPGPESIKDENGNPIMLEIKVLSAATIQKINDGYKNRVVAFDKKGNPYISNGEIVFKSEKDNAKASMHILVEALVYPNLQNPELMEFFDCHDVTEMPLKVFPDSDEFAYINRAVMSALGLSDGPTQEEKEETTDEIKN